MIFLAYYSPGDYVKLLRIAADKDTLCKTWEEWKCEVDKVKTYLESNQLPCTLVEVTVEEIVKYCSENNLPNNGSARSKYVSELGLRNSGTEETNP